MVFYMQGELNDPNPAGRHDQCASEWRRGAGGRRDGSPFGSLSAEVAVTALAARHAPALPGKDVGGGAPRPSRLPGRQDLLAAVDGYGGSLGAEQTHLATSGVRNGHGGEKKTERSMGVVGTGRVRREGSKEGRNRDVEVSTYRDRDILLCISMNRAEEGTRQSSSIQRHRRSAAAIKI